MALPIVEGFSLSHAAILDGTSGAESADIYGIREGSIDVDTDNYDNTGDDSILSSWSWFNSATVTVQSGYLSFAMVTLLSGSTVTSSGTSPNDFYNLPLWNENSLNQSTKPMLIRVPSKDSLGNPRSIDFVLYRVQFDPIKFDGPSYKSGLLLNYSGRATMSSVDEKGTTLTERSMGRIIGRPRL